MSLSSLHGEKPVGRRGSFALGATEIGWHCWASNISSIATALKLGFQKELDYPVITCDSRLTPTWLMYEKRKTKERQGYARAIRTTCIR